MRKLEVRADEFKRFFWGSYVTGQAKSEGDLEIALRVIKKLKYISLENPMTDEERDKGIIPGRQMIDESATLVFEEDEYKSVKDRCVAFVTQVNYILAEEYTDFLNRLKGCEKYEATSEEEKETDG